MSSDSPEIFSDENLLIESELRNAIDRNELDVYYQPQIDVRTGQVVGAEALMRWNHPDKGMIPPNQFIPVAEESGLIHPMGEGILRRACSDLKEWNRCNAFPLRVGINLSGCQFNRPDLMERLIRILQESGADPGHLGLEITESVLIQEPEAAVKRMKELKNLGIHLSLDDFGTGYSSFTYLKQFPFDSVKIDRSFIKNVHYDPKSSAIVSAIIQMAREMNMRIIAEGVETISEYEFLKQHGCDEIQGYLFSAALPAPAFLSYIQSFGFPEVAQ
jgi:EAL domain-containing protein (putative c-di-GMP-specific phosphodiesterase class I)